MARVPPSLLALLTSGDDTNEDSAEAERSERGWLHDLKVLAQNDQDLDRCTDVTAPTLLMQGTDNWDPMPSTMNVFAAILRQVQRTATRGRCTLPRAQPPNSSPTLSETSCARTEDFDEIVRHDLNGLD